MLPSGEIDGGTTLSFENEILRKQLSRPYSLMTADQEPVIKLFASYTSIENGLCRLQSTGIRATRVSYS